MHKIDGAGHLGHMFVMEDALINRPPTEITADFMNALQMELSNVIEWAGLELSKADNGQLLQALQAKFASINPAGDYATKTAVQFDDYKIADASVVGSANAIVAGFFPAITDLASSHGMVLYVRCLADNTITTPTFTPNNGIIAAKTIVKGNNLPLAAGDIAGAGYWASLQYDLTLDKWVLKNPAKGLDPMSYASIAEAQDLTSTTKIITPQTLLLAFQGVNRSPVANGSQLLPGGFILKWGITSPVITNTDFYVTFPIAFPAYCFHANFIATAKDGTAAQNNPSVPAISAGGFTGYCSRSITSTFFWFALGY